MLTLAIESSAKAASAAVCRSGELLGQYLQNNGLTHSRTLMVMAQSLLCNLGLSVSDIGLVAVSYGPGSFTGVRIGVAAAKGLAWGLDIPVCGVSTLDAMAYQYHEPNTILCAVMDARRGQVYNALYRHTDRKPVRLCADRAISLRELASELEGKPCVLIGDGASISFEYLSAAGIPCRIAPALLCNQTAYGVALAAACEECVPASALEPFYLRQSQAERERLGASGKG